MRKVRDKKPSVAVRKRKLKDGTYSLYLDIIFNGNRSTETLDIGRLGVDKKKNKKIEYEAELIKSKRLVQMREGKYFPADNDKGNASLLTYFENYKKAYPKNSSEDVAHMHLKKFVKRYVKGSNKDITFNQVDVKFLEAYKKYLLQLKASRGPKRIISQNTAGLYFNILKRVIKIAVKEDIITTDITPKVKNIKTIDKPVEFLEETEIKKLMNTECKRDPEVKRAFLFACFTGLRLSDLRNLQYKSIQGDKLQIVQKKTVDPLSLPLLGVAQKLLAREDNIFPHPEAYVFKLPTIPHYNNVLKEWFTLAGINKRASSHVARHTAACFLLAKGADIYTVQALLGQKSLASTQRYAKVINPTLVAAVNRLPNWEVAL